MQGKQRQLQTQPHGQESQRHHDGAAVGDGGQDGRQIRHVQRTGHHVHHANADKVESGADGAHDQIPVSGGQGPLIPPQADHDIGRQRRNLQEHEKIKDVAGNGDPQQPRKVEKIHAIKQVDSRFLDLGFDAGPGERHDHRTDEGDDDQHEGVDGVDPVFDSPRRRPIPHRVMDDSRFPHLAQQRQGDGQRNPGDDRGHGPGGIGPAQDQANGRRQQRQDHLQSGILGGNHNSFSLASISSSSMVP